MTFHWFPWGDPCRCWSSEPLSLALDSWCLPLEQRPRRWGAAYRHWRGWGMRWPYCLAKVPKSGSGGMSFLFLCWVEIRSLDANIFVAMGGQSRSEIEQLKTTKIPNHPFVLSYHCCSVLNAFHTRSHVESRCYISQAVGKYRAFLNQNVRFLHSPFFQLEF